MGVNPASTSRRRNLRIASSSSISNRRPEDAAFLVTGMDNSHRAWNGETSWIRKEMLSRHLKDEHSPIYYIAGPPGMVRELRGLPVRRRPSLIVCLVEAP